MSLLRFLLYFFVAYLVWRYLKSAVQAGAWRAASIRPPEPMRRSPHEVLGVAENATDDEIRASYQRLMMQYHPDRVSGMGPEIVAVAEARTKEINEAYNRLKR
jgi:preprotein translocase subunit Sec63